jgi:hypothetical protein
MGASLDCGAKIPQGRMVVFIAKQPIIRAVN